jgi:uncharacterized protein YdaU (DUF1376 family)
MSKDPAFLFYVKDWLCSRTILSMSGDAVKAYIYLLCEAWLQEPRATLPNDEKELKSMARCSEKVWLEIYDELILKFSESLDDGNRIYDKRLMEEHLHRNSNQRFNNKNAKRTRNKREVNAALEDEDEDETANLIAPLDRVCVRRVKGN